QHRQHIGSSIQDPHSGSGFALNVRNARVLRCRHRDSGRATVNDMNPVLVEATRGGIVESAHRGALAVVDARGAAVCTIGDITHPVFARSAVKVLQALPLVTSGAADAFELSDEELALACASHNGETRHVATAAAVLAKAGLDASALECGAHWPQHEVAQRELAASGRPLSALHNNCSGKHAGFL